MVSVLKRAKAAMEEVFCKGSYSKVLQRTPCTTYIYLNIIVGLLYAYLKCVFSILVSFPLILVLVHSLSPIQNLLPEVMQCEGAKQVNRVNNDYPMRQNSSLGNNWDSFKIQFIKPCILKRKKKRTSFVHAYL